MTTHSPNQHREPMHFSSPASRGSFFSPGLAPAPLVHSDSSPRPCGFLPGHFPYQDASLHYARTTCYDRGSGRSSLRVVGCMGRNPVGAASSREWVA